MTGIELNKIAAAVLVAGLIAMVSGVVADGLYHPVEHPEKRGYQVEGAETADTGAGAAPAQDLSKVAIADFLAKASVEKGATVAKKCASCHSFEAGGANKVGPALHGVAGAPIGKHAAGFAYSSAMAGHGGNWDDQSLSEFLAAPAKYIPGTKMSFAGLKKPEERADVIAYLKSLK